MADPIATPPAVAAIWPMRPGPWDGAAGAPIPGRAPSGEAAAGVGAGAEVAIARGGAAGADRAGALGEELRTGALGRGEALRGILLFHGN